MFIKTKIRGFWSMHELSFSRKNPTNNLYLCCKQNLRKEPRATTRYINNMINPLVCNNFKILFMTFLKTQNENFNFKWIVSGWCDGVMTRFDLKTSLINTKLSALQIKLCTFQWHNVRVFVVIC